MDVEACNDEEGTGLFFKLLGKKFKDKTYSNLSKSLEVAKSQIPLYVFTQKLLSEDERKELSVCLSWLFCSLLEISADDRAGR